VPLLAVCRQGCEGLSYRRTVRIVTVWMSRQDIAAILRVPLGTLDRWASNERWRRIKYGGRVLYDWESAAERYRRRRTEGVSLDGATSGEASYVQCDDLCPDDRA